MEEFLFALKGKEVDIAFGGSAVVRGTITDLKSGVLYLEDEDGAKLYVAVDKVTTVCETKEHLSRPGFVVQ
jgi:hypothetical protein